MNGGIDILWLDDIRDPKNFINVDYDVVWVKTYDDFVKTVTEKMPLIVSFDHDLGTDKSGYDCAKWLINYCIEKNIAVPEYNIHSANPIGRANIDSLFKSYNKIFK